jgi:hypothetical protein
MLLVLIPSSNYGDTLDRALLPHYPIDPDEMHNTAAL